MVKARKHQLSSLTPEELLKLLKVARASSTRDWAMVLVQYSHGLRSSELCGLVLDDLDMKSQSITITRLKGSLKTTQPLFAHKGRPELDEIKAIRAYLAIRPETGSKALFVSQKGSHLDRSAWNRIYKALAQKAELPTHLQHCHCLKHSRAKHLIQGNVNLALVRQSLGHSNIQSTMRYLNTTDAEAGEAAKRAIQDLF
jgi:integrase